MKTHEIEGNGQGENKQVLTVEFDTRIRYLMWGGDLLEDGEILIELMKSMKFKVGECIKIVDFESVVNKMAWF